MTAVPLTLTRRPRDVRPATWAEAERAGRALAGAPAEEVLGWAFDRFGPGLAVAASMGDTVLVHLAAQLSPGVPVVFLDTGYHFPETVGTAAAVEVVYDVTLETVRPSQTVAEQDAEHRERLYERDPDLCCALRKVEPLARALAPYAAWATGARRAEATTRSGLREVEWDPKRGMVKVNPLAGWSDDDVDAYVAEHGVLVNPLLSEGYPSIGCAPCTRRVAPGADPRSGRWAGTGKTECGLHA